MRLDPNQSRHRTVIKCVILGGVSAAVLLAGMLGYLWRASLQDSLITLSVASGLSLQEVRIKGRVNADYADFERNLEPLWHQSMLTLDLNQIHEKVAALGWVRGAKIERVLPSTLIITIKERNALALYQNDAGHQVIDHFGAVIDGVRPEAFTHLPVIKGPNAPQHAKEILTMLKKEDLLFTDVWSLTYQSNRRWDVYLRNNIRIQLPEKNAAAAWSKLAKMDRAHRLTKRDVVNIDLRVPNKLVIRPSRARSSKGSNT